MSESQPLKQFFAVTKNSLYCVSFDSEGGMATKLDPNNPAQVLGHLERRPFVDISMEGIALYLDTAQPIVQPPQGKPHPCPIEEVNSNWRGGKTSHLRALCLRQQDALELVRGDAAASNPLDLTKEALRAIGDDHPFYIVRRGGDTGFPSEYFE